MYQLTFSKAVIMNTHVLYSTGKQQEKKFIQTSPKQALVFTCLHYKSFENTVGKGGIARNEHFLLFPQCFLAIWRIFCHFHQI